MEQLPNNCRVGKISIHPKNWNSKKISKDDVNLKPGKTKGGD